MATSADAFQVLPRRHRSVPDPDPDPDADPDSDGAGAGTGDGDASEFSVAAGAGAGDCALYGHSALDGLMRASPKFMFDSTPANPADFNSVASFPSSFAENMASNCLVTALAFASDKPATTKKTSTPAFPSSAAVVPAEAPPWGDADVTVTLERSHPIAFAVVSVKIFCFCVSLNCVVVVGLMVTNPRTVQLPCSPSPMTIP